MFRNINDWTKEKLTKEIDVTQKLITKLTKEIENNNDELLKKREKLMAEQEKIINLQNLLKQVY